MDPRRHDRLTATEAVIALLAGGAGLFGTYWDDSWHTDRGRDDLVSPPHLLLYAGVLLGVGVAAAWAVRAARSRGWRHALRTPGGPRTAFVGGFAVLVSAPIDELWHTTYGRDAVLWSPPHLLAVAGSAALTVGLVMGLRPGSATAVIGAALAVGAYVVPVMEFESDVPQFDVALYLPALSVGLALAAPIVRRLVGGAWPLTAAAAAYTVARVAIAGGLAGLGHSTPIVPPILVAAMTVDMLRRRTGRSGLVAAIAIAVLHASYVPYLRVVPHGLSLDRNDISASIALSLIMVAVVAAATGTARPARPVLATMVVAAGLLLADVRPADAHDPGQGDLVGTTRFHIRVEHGEMDVTVELPRRGCKTSPAWIVARRAGVVIRQRASVDDACVAAARIVVDKPGRWFIYVELGELESWTPVETGDVTTVSAERDLYERPEPTATTTQVIAGVPLIAAAAALLGGASRAAGKSVVRA